RYCPGQPDRQPQEAPVLTPPQPLSSIAISSNANASVPLQDGDVVLVGAGKMGGALLEGWIGLGVDPACIAVIEPEPAAPVTALAASGLRINPDAASLRPAAIVIAVKPQIAPQIMPDVAALMAPSTVAVSIMAGRTIAFLAAAMPEGAAVVRALPNTPAAIGRGITGAVPNHPAGAAPPRPPAAAPGP